MKADLKQGLEEKLGPLQWSLSPKKMSWHSVLILRNWYTTDKSSKRALASQAGKLGQQFKQNGEGWIADRKKAELFKSSELAENII